jgi:hypothetical protein
MSWVYAARNVFAAELLVREPAARAARNVGLVPDTPKENGG